MAVEQSLRGNDIDGLSQNLRNQVSHPVDVYWADGGVVAAVSNEEVPFSDTKKWALVVTNSNE